jgi:hypothetical protein
MAALSIPAVVEEVVRGPAGIAWGPLGDGGKAADEQQGHRSNEADDAHGVLPEMVS